MYRHLTKQIKTGLNNSATCTHEPLAVQTAQLPPSVSSTIPMLSKRDCFLDLGRCDGGGDNWFDEEAVDLRDEVDR